MCDKPSNSPPERPATPDSPKASTPRAPASDHGPEPAPTHEVSAATPCPEDPDAKRQAWLSTRQRHPALGLCRR
ncbi:hypothetical protein [Rhodoferax sp. U11-2br]|uniref:hypothetical protein n=1 Tax=Rhodoferax sp. U11-2br TaxID=2838878 RepID=UPI001BE97B64|nr:hypothetical protein [Rhodoferax sp. U11-2br]MBT3066433.1 hypothetical protein [Rhodoferax sp. U11-2br]